MLFVINNFRIFIYSFFFLSLFNFYYYFFFNVYKNKYFVPPIKLIPLLITFYFFRYISLLESCKPLESVILLVPSPIQPSLSGIMRSKFFLLPVTIFLSVFVIVVTAITTSKSGYSNLKSHHFGF